MADTSKSGSNGPQKIVPFPNGEIGIVWADGKESYVNAWELRCACPCASCVDEMTGRKVLENSTVPRSVRVKAIHSVGNYAVSFEWSDSHDTGIYTFAKLREHAGD